jgi:hypothetical protein
MYLIAQVLLLILPYVAFVIGLYIGTMNKKSAQKRDRAAELYSSLNWEHVPEKDRAEICLILAKNITWYLVPDKMKKDIYEVLVREGGRE